MAAAALTTSGGGGGGVQGQPGLLESTRRIVVFRARHIAAGLPRDARGPLL